jgi:internalin A
MTNKWLLKIIEKAKASGATRLDLSDKGLTTLPPEIGQLTNLTILDLSHNQLTRLPPEIGQLTKLTLLDLDRNQLTALQPKIGQLTNLKNLWLIGNQLTALPPEIDQLPKLKHIYLSDNPLTSPPLEIARQGIEAIRRYCASLKPEDQPLNEVKLILVGEGAAGKTSLVKQLLGEGFNKREDTTHGISIRGWETEAGDRKIRVNIWDFGGQEIQHATHQFFLSRRSLYVLVLDARRDDKTEYWLQYIQSFGGSSPILVVLNKEDENPSFDVNRPFLLQKYPGIRHFFRTCCADGRGINRFKEVLLDELAKVEMIGIRWPQSWFQVKQRIEQADKPYISCEEYESICAEAGITEEQSRKILVDFLHDLGAAVHFDDYVLNAMHVLDPIWVTQAVYKIITAKEMADSKGLLRLERLAEILRQNGDERHSWPVHTHVFILELMKKFQLCWGIGEQAVLLPQLLPVAEPEFDFDYSGALGFVLHYHDFLPPSVFPRFMVKVHQSIKPGLCWRTGVVLEDTASGSLAAVKADIEARRIRFWVHGPRRKEYLTFLWFSLREINDSFKQLNVSERIPMPDAPYVSADYQTLLNCLKEGMERYMPDRAEKSYSVKELLGLVEPKDEEELVRLMRKINEHLDEKESTAETVSSILEVKPGLFGISLNVNELFTKILGRKKQKGC